MAYWLEMDWVQAFVPVMTFPEVLIRATVVYVALVLLLRVILKRQAGKLSISDLLVVALVAGICRNPLVRDSYSITDGLLVIIVVLFWSFAMDWLSFYVPWIHAVLHPTPVCLIDDGVVLKDNLRHELITESQLQCKLRHAGIKDPDLVAHAYIEGDGQMSIIRKDAPAPLPAPPATRPSSAMNGRPVNGCVASAEGGGLELEAWAFCEAAEKLHEILAWHQERVADYEGAIRDAQQLLGDLTARAKKAAKRQQPPVPPSSASNP